MWCVVVLRQIITFHRNILGPFKRTQIPMTGIYTEVFYVSQEAGRNERTCLDLLLNGETKKKKKNGQTKKCESIIIRSTFTTESLILHRNKRFTQSLIYNFSHQQQPFTLLFQKLPSTMSISSDIGSPPQSPKLLPMMMTGRSSPRSAIMAASSPLLSAPPLKKRRTSSSSSSLSSPLSFEQQERKRIKSDTSIENILLPTLSSEALLRCDGDLPSCRLAPRTKKRDYC